MISLDEAKNLFEYDDQSGIVSKKSTGSRGYDNGKGYLCFPYKGHILSAHRLAWLLTFGKFPVGALDHVNSVKTDNRISNLREATTQQNNANRKGWARNVSKAKGVSPKYKNGKFTGKWVAQITVNKKNHHLGYFATVEEASEAYKIAAKSHFGEFARG